MKPVGIERATLSLLLLLTSFVTAIPFAGAAGPPADRELNRNVILPGGYSIRTAVSGLNFPTGVTFVDGTLYVSEAGGIAGTEPRVVRVNSDGSTTAIGSGWNGPVTDVKFHDGWLYVSHQGMVSRIRPDGTDRADVITGLPSMGDHSNAEITFGPDGKLYVAVGTATNSGVVGPDNFLFGWPQRFPEFHDVPCEDITVRATNYTSEDPRTSDPNDTAVTGPFQPFGEPATEGEVIEGSVKCNGSILRANPDGSDLEVFAWGLRNSFGIGFDDTGQLWATNNGMDERGSRPVEGDLDYLLRIVFDEWYGWPDYSSGDPVNQARFAVEGEIPRLLTESTPDLSRFAEPVASFEDHVSANKFDFSTSDRFQFVGDAFVAETGSFPPVTGAEEFFGYRVTRVDMESGEVTVFLANKSGEPSFASGEPGINKPIDVKFDPDHPERMYVVDFGAFLPAPGTEEVDPMAEAGSGRIFLVARNRDLNAIAREDTRRPRFTRVANSLSSEVRLAFALAQPAKASLKIYDVHGRLVRTLIQDSESDLEREVTWDTRDDQSRSVPRGLYLARLTAGGAHADRKILIAGSR